MKKNFNIIAIIIFIIFLTNTSYAKNGKGELKLSKFTMENVLMYMYGAGNKTKYSNTKKNDPLIIAISENGRHSYYFYCPAQYRAYGCMDNHTKRKAITSCEKSSKGSSCYIFAIKRRVVWKNGGDKVKIKTKDLKSPYIVAKKIQDAGFYDGNLSELTGISVETGQLDDSIKVIGKKKKKSNITSSSNEIDIVKELETLTKLYKNGVLTKEEFDKAKSKLLKN